jgi:hypothetical protein
VSGVLVNGENALGVLCASSLWVNPVHFIEVTCSQGVLKKDPSLGRYGHP